MTLTKQNSQMVHPQGTGFELAVGQCEAHRRVGVDSCKSCVPIFLDCLKITLWHWTRNQRVPLVNLYFNQVSCVPS